MKKGSSLIEILTVLAVIAVISVPLSRLAKLIRYDFPKSLKLVECNTSIFDVLTYMKRDINSAVGFPKAADGYKAGDDCLLIEHKSGTVCYLAGQGEIKKITTGSKDEIVWQIPNGKIEWHVWEKDGKGYAVEIKKYTELKSYNHTERKMENSFVYFAGAYQEAMN